MANADKESESRVRATRVIFRHLGANEQATEDLLVSVVP